MRIPVAHLAALSVALAFVPGCAAVNPADTAPLRGGAREDSVTSVEQPQNPGAAARQVRLHGAASVVDSLVRPHAEAVQQRTGLVLTIERSNAGQGLKDLVQGRCDMAMASASLETTLAAARAAGLAGEVPELRLHVVATSEVVFIVHPSNPVKALTWEQLKDIHTGKIARWNDVGGRDEPIVVFTDAAASATRGLVKQVVLAGGEYAPGARAVAAVKDVNEQVAATPAAVGALGLEFVDPQRVAVVQTKRVERPLAFVTVGAPGPEAQKVIEAYRAVSAR